jgi:hypothetical protein
LLGLIPEVASGGVSGLVSCPGGDSQPRYTVGNIFCMNRKHDQRTRTFHVLYSPPDESKPTAGRPRTLLRYFCGQNAFWHESEDDQALCITLSETFDTALDSARLGSTQLTLAPYAPPILPPKRIDPPTQYGLAPWPSIVQPVSPVPVPAKTPPAPPTATSRRHWLAWGCMPGWKLGVEPLLHAKGFIV